MRSGLHGHGTVYAQKQLGVGGGVCQLDTRGSEYSMNCISGNFLKIMEIMESTTPIINSRAGENSPYKQL